MATQTDDGLMDRWRITPREAAEVAREFGLSLPDAQALSVLAEDRADAERLAAMFAPSKPKAKTKASA